MNIDKNNNNLWKIDNKKLLEELVLDIAKKYWIDKEDTKDLIKKETLTWIDSLKKEIQKKNYEGKKLNESELENLFFTLKWALEIIENSSKIEIKSLREDVEKYINIDDFKNRIEDFLPPNLVFKAKNAEKLHEHILWFALWSANSILTTVEYLYQIWKWIILAPYHLYMIISWKSETESFKDI